jgi:hypothetical protein
MVGYQSRTGSNEIPLNVMARPGLPTAKELTKLGVRRSSAGGAISQVIWNYAFRVGEEVPTFRRFRGRS